THVFDVNIVEKIKADGKANIGFPDNQSFVRNLVEDRLWGKHKALNGKLITELSRTCLNTEKLRKLYKPPDPLNFLPEEKTKRNAKNNADSSPQVNRDLNGDAQTPGTSLKTFLKFCSLKYPARNYALFILGHGLIVGNDVFLFDESSPVHSLSLPNLRVLLTNFK